jgi:hypothetical protein
MEDRWETLERLERAARDTGRTVLRTEHLDLVRTSAGALVRVGRAPRPELALWRYGDRLPPAVARGLGAWLRRLVMAVPSYAFGYNAGYGAVPLDGSADRWLASPFLDHAPTLTAAFLHIPLAERCPACHRPLAVAPWRFQALRFVAESATPSVVTHCGLCGTEVAVPAAGVRPALRLGLSIVNRGLAGAPVVEGAARRLDRSDGPAGLLAGLAAEAAAVGELSPTDRLALGIALDEQSEAELLELEWREAEELAAIVDEELTDVPGFAEFRRQVLG